MDQNTENRDISAAGASSGQAGMGGTYRAPSTSRNAGRETPWDEENRAGRAAEDAKRVAGEAYDRTTEVASQSFDRAVSYFKDNPGTLALVSLGAGIGIGLVIANGGFSTRGARMGRYAEPLVNAISGIALEFLRSR